jgi:phage terminase large subunit GpA-like protein
MREPYDVVTDPEVETVVFMASSQVGKTEYLLNISGYYMSEDPAPILLVEPTLDIAEAYSKDRLAPMIRDTAVLTPLIGETRAKDGNNKILHKKFPGGHITLTGSNSAAGLSSRPVRIVLLDEVDRYAPSAGTEGNPIKLAIKRATTFWNRKKIYASSPGIKNLSNIEAAFKASDQRYFHVPCPLCHKSQKLEWGYVRWEEGKAETAVYICRHCGSAWDDGLRHDAVHEGKWIAEAPFNSIAGFFIWEAYNPWIKLSELVAAFLDANERAKQGDTESLKAFVNTSLGETWTEAAEIADPEPLLKRRENYAAKSLPWPILYLTCGVDVQDDRLEYEVVGWRAEKRNETEQSWGVENGVLLGDPANADVWEALDEILLSEWQTEDGRALRIMATGIDSGGHHTQDVYQFCNRRAGRHVYAIKGMDGPRPMWPPRAGKSKKYRGTKVWIVGVDTAKDAIYSRLKIEAVGPGYCHFPVAYDETFFRQLTSEKVRTVFVKGFPRRQWYKEQAVRNEALDRRAYAMCVLHSRAIAWEVLARGAKPPPEPPAAPPSGDDKPPPAAPSSPPTPAAAINRRFIRVRIGGSR